MKNSHRFSLLRFLGLSFLAVGAHAQSTEPFPAFFELSSLNGTNGFTVNGITNFDKSGFSVSQAGDVNGDGVDDIIIGAAFASPNGHENAGQTHIVFGSKAPFPAIFELSSLNGTNGFTLNGIEKGDKSGWSVSQAGDINDDKIDDIIIGAYEASPTGRRNAGQTYIVFGRNTSFPATFELSSLDGANGFTLNGIKAKDRRGFSVSEAGDLNGDGVDDIIIGISRPRSTVVRATNGIRRDNIGKAYVFFGRKNLLRKDFRGFSLEMTVGTLLPHSSPLFSVSTSASKAGDINGDGIDDIIIRASGIHPNGYYLSGQVYVVFGRKTPFPGTFQLSSLDGTNGFILNGITSSKGNDVSVSQAGDINGDGIDDIIIGVPDASSFSGHFNAGRTYVIFGRNFSLPVAVPSTTSKMETTTEIETTTAEPPFIEIDTSNAPAISPIPFLFMSELLRELL